MGRIERINQAVKREISILIHTEIKDPRLEFVTINNVEVSRDLQHARVYFTVLGDEKQALRAQEGLNSAKGFLRKLLGKRVRMRYTPEIDFIFDKSLEYSERIEDALKEIRNESRTDHQNHQKK